MLSSDVPVIVVRSFIALVPLDRDERAASRASLKRLAGSAGSRVTSRDGHVELVFDVSSPTAARETVAPDRLTLIVGDDSEWDESRGASCMARAACIEWDAVTGSIGILSSITALPPVFVVRLQGFLLLTSALDLVRSSARIALSLEPESVQDLFRFGYPLDYRTLFTGVTLMPAGHRLTFDERGRERLARAWHPARPGEGPCDTPVIDRELAAFERAVRRMRLDDSIFTLTAGLDTRAILALLTKLDAKPVACTITGDRTVCLDARVAQILSKEYGLRHVLLRGSALLR